MSGGRASGLGTARARLVAPTTLACVLVLALVIAGCSTGSSKAKAAAPVTPPSAATTTTGPAVETRNAIEIENAMPGTTAWHINGPAFGVVGYADHVSVEPGESFTLYVSSLAPTYRVEAYRIGWYQGKGGRLVWRSSPQPGVRQPDPELERSTRTVRAQWLPSLSMEVPDDWLPGQYLLKLVTDIGQSYVPLTVRDDSSNAPVLVMSGVTTWQAYNDWGGYSLYHGPRNDPGTRAKIVTFDRPYARDGSGDFLSAELGFVTLVEHLGLDVSYTTNIDVHEHPELLSNHKVLVSLGHDEYWSRSIREGVEAARDKGMNIMFLGANALFRRIRLQPSPKGADGTR